MIILNFSLGQEKEKKYNETELKPFLSGRHFFGSAHVKCHVYNAENTRWDNPIRDFKS